MPEAFKYTKARVEMIIDHLQSLRADETEINEKIREVVSINFYQFLASISRLEPDASNQEIEAVGAVLSSLLARKTTRF